MRVSVTWPNGNEREVEIHSQLQLERFISWHTQEGLHVDVRKTPHVVQLVCSAVVQESRAA